MAKKLDPRLIEILKQHNEDPEQALWDCHGTWVAYHAAIERIAAKAGVTFDMPEIIHQDASKGEVCIAVVGKMGERVEWSFGEVSPKNNKNSYPYAMAEKRAKDRVTLKLVGLHGLYSEEESDDFKRNGAEPETPTKSSAALKRDDAWNKMMFRVSAELGDVKTPQQLEEVKAHWREVAKSEGWTRAWMSALGNEFDQFQDQMIANMEREESLPDHLANSHQRPLETETT